MTLTADREVNHYISQETRTFPVAASVNIFKGAMLSVRSTGFIGPLVAGEKFAGFAYAAADNSSGSNGDIKVKVFTQGDFEHSVTSLAQANLGDPVYATSDDTLTLVASASTFVGVTQDVLSAGEAIVRIDPLKAAAQ